MDDHGWYLQPLGNLQIAILCGRDDTPFDLSILHFRQTQTLHAMCLTWHGKSVGYPC